ncbi:MAG: hypothetical protein MUE53_00800 [Chitinophagales bacterium]|jgi:drug/metabolite transporter (DMT)-like permease|nr:hypothetical protein [Chitinophagales bacterium]
MTYLISSIVLTGGLLLILRFFSNLKLNLLQAIVSNYFTAFLLGFILKLSEISLKSDLIFSSFTYYHVGAIISGTLFFVSFSFASKANQIIGTSTTALMFKLSLIIPILIGIFWLGQPYHKFNLLGIMLTFVSIFLIFADKSLQLTRQSINMALLLLILSGVSDGLIQLSAHYFPIENQSGLTPVFMFLFSFLSGFLYLLATNREKYDARSFQYGIFLGVVNYFSLDHLIIGLTELQKTLSSFVIYSTYSIGVILVTILGAILFFKEKISLQKFIGILIAIISIVAMNYK